MALCLSNRLMNQFSKNQEIMIIELFNDFQIIPNYYKNRYFKFAKRQDNSNIIKAYCYERTNGINPKCRKAL